MTKKRLNNKGVTLVELIVSFTIVAVAVIYFYQMLISVTKMYANAREDVNHAAKVNYAFRILDEAYKQDTIDEVCSDDGILQNITTYCEYVGNNGIYDRIDLIIEKYDNEQKKVIEKKYSLYKYVDDSI